MMLWACAKKMSSPGTEMQSRRHGEAGGVVRLWASAGDHGPHPIFEVEQASPQPSRGSMMQQQREIGQVVGARSVVVGRRDVVS